MVTEQLKPTSVSSHCTPIKKRSFNTKNNFCIFCNKLNTKIVRHYGMVHKNEKRIQEFLHLPKRKHLIQDI